MPDQLPQLPDGSSSFTATVMSKEEAMKLPLKERLICHRISSEMYHAVFEAIGAASMAWCPRPSTEVFHSEEASKIAVELCFKIANEVEDSPARTLLREIYVEYQNKRIELPIEITGKIVNMIGTGI